MQRLPTIFFALSIGSAIALALAACSSGDDERRVIEITQTNDSCTPESIDLKAGEKVTFRITNEGTKDKEVEGIDGTKLEELLVPAGKTRTINYTAPGSQDSAKLKCYVPGGSSTIIDLNIAAGAADAGNGSDAQASPATSAATARETVSAELLEYKVTPDKATVGAGPVKFVARNTSKTEVHELAVLRVKGNNDYENLGEIEDIDPGATGEVVLDLPPGDYLLACLIAAGEAGSKVDHFQQGMRTAFTVK